MKSNFRASMAWLHTGLGLITGWVLFAIALSGTLSVFRQEISVWMRPELSATSISPIEASAHAVEWLTQNAPTSPAWYLNAPTQQEPFTLGVWSDPKGVYLQKALSPQTGSPDGIRQTFGGEFFYRFHFELQLPYPFGRLIAAIAALALVVGLISGVIIHRRIFADFFTFRPGKGQRSWLDAHNLLGVLALPFHLMISFTGAVTLGTLLLPWSTQAVYKHDLMATYTDLNPALDARPPSGHPGHLAPILPILQDAERRIGEAGIAQIYIFNPTDQASVITITSGNTNTVSTTSHTLNFDGTNGHLLSEHVEKRPLIGAYTFLYGLHVARFAPNVTRWLYFVCGLMLTTVIGSGMRLWTIKRLRSNPHLGHVLTERLNVGVLAGLSLAFASYFLANRILPAGLPGREDHEIQCVFIIWALALIFALFRKSEAAWTELLAACALACLAVAALGAPWRDSVSAATSVTAALFAGSFAYAAINTYRKKRLSP